MERKNIRRMDMKANFGLLNKHVERHSGLMIIAASIVSLVALFFSVYWHFDNNSLGETIDYAYLFGNVSFFILSIGLTVFLAVSHGKKHKTNALAIVIHIYVLLLMGWGTAVCVLDLHYGLSPLFYLMVLTIISGLFVVEPLFFFVVIASSASVVLATSLHKGVDFFAGPYRAENIVTFVTYFVVLLIVGGEHFGITINDYRIQHRLEQMNYIDDLTGLLNERSYFKETDEIENLLKEKKLTEFAVIVMDLNNIKATNDEYGHRYGCHLIVNCGHQLPNYFKSSKLFHIGGDEFVAIVYGEDYQNLDNILKTYDEKLTYSKIHYEDHELIFSLAYGYAKLEPGMNYKKVFQKADDMMYSNKEAIKKKYGLKSR